MPQATPPPGAGLPPRSMLFVSGEQAARFPKAMLSGADLVCIDLEDAVAPARKAEARAQALEWLAAHAAATEPHADAPGPAIALRVNGLHSTHGLHDLDALAASGARLDWLLLPKAERAADVAAADARCGRRVGAIAALIETPLGVENAASLAMAGGRLGALMLGGADLAAALGARLAWESLLYARGRLLNSARAHELQAWDVPWFDLTDVAGLSAETARIAALGFDCKTAIHPAQIAAIHAGFAPPAEELAWAEALLAETGDGPATGAFLFRGAMVDAPVLQRARRIARR